MPNHHFGVADATTIDNPLTSEFRHRLRLVIGSPPYLDRRSYGIGAQRQVAEWIKFMVKCTRNAVRIAPTASVVWVCNGCVKRGIYQPAVEGLIYALWFEGMRVEHPLVWQKNSAPNRRDWWCNGWEYIVAVRNSEGEKTWNWEAVARPHAFPPGGVFRQRGVNGQRRIGRQRARAPLARPYDIIHATVGGGHMGHALATENEAPYPVSLIKPIILALTRAGDYILDPFAGSGSTMQACEETGRHSLNYDIRASQTGSNGLAWRRFMEISNRRQA